MTAEYVQQLARSLQFRKHIPVGDLRGAICEEQERLCLRVRVMELAQAGEFQQFGAAIRSPLFDRDACERWVKASQRGGLEPWIERGEPAGHAEAWPRCFGVRKTAAGWWAEGLEAELPDQIAGGAPQHYGLAGYVSCDLWVARAYCRVLGRGSWGIAVQRHLLSLEGENSIESRCFIAEDGRIVNLVGLKPGGIPSPSMWRLLCGLVEPASIVALAASIQKELAVLGLRWERSVGRWDLDVERMVLTLRGGAVGVSGGSALASDFQATHSEVLKQLQDFVASQGRWPLPVVGCVAWQGVCKSRHKEHRLATRVAHIASKFGEKVICLWGDRSSAQWLQLIDAQTLRGDCGKACVHRPATTGGDGALVLGACRVAQGDAMMDGEDACAPSSEVIGDADVEMPLGCDFTRAV